MNHNSGLTGTDYSKVSTQDLFDQLDSLADHIQKKEEQTYQRLGY